MLQFKSMRWTHLILFLLCFSLKLKAEITNFNISGTSNTFDTTNASNNEAWGVFVGPYDPSQTEPYSSCKITPPQCAEPENDFIYSGCHDHRVNYNTVIQISFTETSDFTGSRLATAQRVTTTGGAESKIKFQDSLSTYTQGQTATLTFTWGQLCTEVGGNINLDYVKNVTCNGGTNVNLNGLCLKDDQSPMSADIKLVIGLYDSNQSDLISEKPVTFKLYTPNPERGLITPNDCSGDFGFCDINIYPGDGGGSLFSDENTSHEITLFSPSFQYNRLDINNTEGSDNLNYTGLRVYFSADHYQTIHPSNSEVKEVDFILSTPGSGDENFLENNFSGLQNDVQYFFKAASIDESGTVSQFFDDSYFQIADCLGPGQTVLTTCPYSITPSLVAGLFTENSCFITTATYGSSQASQVKIFKKFRKTFLWTNTFGRKIIQTYNAYGPIGARWIMKNPTARFITRLLLYPLHLFAKTSLNYGLIFTSVLTLFSLVLLMFGFKRVFFLNKIRNK